MNFTRTALLVAGLMLLASAAQAAKPLNCRVLYRITCAPDLCSPLDKVVDQVPQIPAIKITISADRKTLTYAEKRKKRTARIHVARLPGDVHLVTGKIHWPSYESPPDSKAAPLGAVHMLFDKMNYYWRVYYLGTSEAQEYEDVLIGDCLNEKW